jgi:hypothetical protein
LDIASRFKDFFKKKSSAASGADVPENENKKRELRKMEDPDVGHLCGHGPVQL